MGEIVAANECIDVNISTQTKGTCWFHALTNPFLLSRKLRPYLYKAVAEYINTKITDRAHLEEWLKPQAPSCISPFKRWSRVYAMKKLWAALFYETRPTFTNTRNPANKSENEIKNLLGGTNLRARTNFMTGASTSLHLEIFLKRVGFVNYTLVNVLNNNIILDVGDPNKKDFIAAYNPDGTATFTLEPDETINYNGTRYKLDCASIVLFGNEKFGAGLHAVHAITGFTCNGRRMIYDSNMLRSYQCDWKNVNNIISNRNYQNETANKYTPYNLRGRNKAQWVRGEYSFLIYTRTDSNESENLYNRDALGINISKLRRRITQTNAQRNNIAQRTRNEIARRNAAARAARNRAERQARVNAETGERLAREMAERNAAARAARNAAARNRAARQERLNAETGERLARERAARAAASAPSLNINFNNLEQSLVNLNMNKWRSITANRSNNNIIRNVIARGLKNTNSSNAFNNHATRNEWNRINQGPLFIQFLFARLPSFYANQKYRLAMNITASNKARMLSESRRRRHIFAKLRSWAHRDSNLEKFIDKFLERETQIARRIQSR